MISMTVYKCNDNLMPENYHPMSKFILQTAVNNGRQSKFVPTSGFFYHLLRMRAE